MHGAEGHLLLATRAFIEERGMTADELNHAVGLRENAIEHWLDNGRRLHRNEQQKLEAWLSGYDAAQSALRAGDFDEPGSATPDNGEFDYDRRMEIYKVVVGATENGIDRRHALNRFYFSVVVAIFVSISFVTRTENSDFPTTVIVSGALMLACLNNVLWLSSILAARALNRSKYDVIIELERHLEYAPFTREWDFHVANRRDRLQFTMIEIMLPVVLTILCVVLLYLLAAGIVSL